MTRDYFFRIDTIHLSYEFDCMYDTWIPVSVELTDDEFSQLLEASKRWYNAEEFEKERKDPRIDDEEYFIHKFVPEIHAKVRKAIDEQLPTIFGKGILSETGNVDIYCPRDVEYYSFEDSEKYDSLFLLKDEGKALKECNINANGEIKIPQGVREISLCAFTYCSRVKRVIVPDSVRVLGPLTFDHCFSLESIELPNSIESIELCDFGTCWNLKDIKIPNSVRLIGKTSFACCASLREISIPESVEEIREGAFEDCRALETLYIYSSKCKIAETAFRHCTNLKEIHLNIQDVSMMGDIFEDVDKSRCLLYVPENLISVYQDHPYFNDFMEIRAH